LLQGAYDVVRNVSLALCFAAIGTVTLARAPAAATGVLAPYRAVYDLAIDPERDSGKFTSVTGRNVTEFTGSRCAGYTTQARFVTDGRDADGKRRITDSRMRSVETADGRFDFTNETYTDSELTEASAGVAKRQADGRVSVNLTAPAPKTLTLPAGAVFPTELLEGIIAGARKGTRFTGFDLYDGSGDGETTLATVAVIGRQAADSGVGADTSITEAGFAADPHWPVTVSYFDKKERSDESPLYVMSAMFYQNGIAGQVKFIYGKLVLTGRLTTLTMLPATPCPG
jgi:hypothetical protein